MDIDHDRCLETVSSSRNPPSPVALSRYVMELFEERTGNETGDTQETQSPVPGVEVISKEDDFDALFDAFVKQG